MDRIDRMRHLINTTHVSDVIDIDLNSNEDEDDEGEEVNVATDARYLETILDECLEDDDEDNEHNTSNENETETEEREDLIIYTKDDNPYEKIETDSSSLFQVIGNEVITITRGDGVCCLCENETRILSVDNSFFLNIPAQLCLGCIQNVLQSL